VAVGQADRAVHQVDGIAIATGGIIRVERMKSIRSSFSGTLEREEA